MPVDIASAAAELVAGLISEPWGSVSPSVYETGRLVTLTPWLTGHAQRLEYLLASQRGDGGWGAPISGYALVPTLSATEALLATLRRSDPDPELSEAADRGLGLLFKRLNGAQVLGFPDDFPDLPALELIAPYLIGLINGHLDALPGRRHEGERLNHPPGMEETTLRLVRHRLLASGDLPTKLFHALEVTGGAACGRSGVTTATGAVGASPAATAAWLGDLKPPSHHPSRRYLESVVERYNGLAPCCYPITVFERGWVLSWLTRAGIRLDVPEELVKSLEDALGPDGTPAAAGLPADADTTAGALYALALLGAPSNPDILLAYELDTHFCTWRGEDAHSVTTNAHVLEAFGQYARTRPGDAARYAPTIGKVSSWLCAQQSADGGWRDRWHASPYYATFCCAVALHHFGGDGARAAVERAVRWVLDTQRPDGSWGVWGGTAEETAYAVQILLLTRAGPEQERTRAAALGSGHLLSGTEQGSGPPMWHDKDLYFPQAIVRSAVLVALHLVVCNQIVSIG